MSNDQDRLYVVIYERGGRLHQCPCMHATPESAHACADRRRGIAIMVWIKDRTPQFAEFWRSPELDLDPHG